MSYPQGDILRCLRGASPGGFGVVPMHRPVQFAPPAWAYARPRGLELWRSHGGEAPNSPLPRRASPHAAAPQLFRSGSESLRSSFLRDVDSLSSASPSGPAEPPSKATCTRHRLQSKERQANVAFNSSSTQNRC